MQSEVYINKAHFLSNLLTLRKVIGERPLLMAVLKANAYGHDLALISKICQESKLVDYLGVCEIKEALLLKKLKIKLPILVLSYTALEEDLYPFAISNGIELTLTDFSTAQKLSRLALKIGKPAIIHLKLETGLNRLGFREKDLELLRKISRLPYLEIKGVFSHLAAVEEKRYSYTEYQRRNFLEFIHRLKKEKIIKPEALCHLAASAAAMVLEQTRFDLVRSGISLYGLYPSLEIKKILEQKNIKLLPVLSWETKVLALKNARKGETIGYGCTYKIEKPMVLAVLAVGYADGYDRSLSNRGWVLIKGEKVPVVGRVAMNLTVVDVSKIKNHVKIGERAVLIGRDKNEEISADDLARWAKTINYEITTRINWQIKRKLI